MLSLLLFAKRTQLMPLHVAQDEISVLFRCSLDGDTKRLKEAIESGMNVNVSDEVGCCL